MDNMHGQQRRLNTTTENYSHCKQLTIIIMLVGSLEGSGTSVQSVLLLLIMPPYIFPTCKHACNSSLQTIFMPFHYTVSQPTLYNFTLYFIL